MQNETFCEALEDRKQEQLPVILTAAEAMDVLGVGKNTMYKLLASGALEGVRIGRLWRVTNTAVEKFMLVNNCPEG